jgi:hypothetical protein
VPAFGKIIFPKLPSIPSSFHFRTRAVLLPIIQKWIRAGTTIISDCWRAYDVLSDVGYQHLRVNHSLNFVDPDSGAHTNSIEATWNHAKRSLPLGHRKKQHFPSHLAKYMFMKRCRILKLDPTIEFFRMAGQVYNPLNPRFADDQQLERDDLDQEDVDENDFN